MVEKCTWELDDPEDIMYWLFNSACGNSAYFSEDPPCNVGWNFCPFCGKPIEWEIPE